MSDHLAHISSSASSDPALQDSRGLYQYFLLTQAYAPDSNTPHYHAKDGAGGTAQVALPKGAFGNFAGLTNERLDAIKKMGMSAIWLSPVYNADPTMPGFTYNATDYRSVNPIYGTADDLKALTQRAHVKGLKVVLDEVFNHTANAHPWFQASRDSHHPEHEKYKDFYVWQEPIRVGKEEAAANPALSKVFVSDDQLREAILEDIAKGGDGKSCLPKVEVPLRDSTGSVMHKKNPETGKDIQQIATVTLSPAMDWWSRSKDGLMDRVVTTDGLPVAIDRSNIPRKADGTQVWVALPIKDENGKILYPPNNYLNCDGDRAWDYDSQRGQMYLHLFHDTMPDLNIGNRQVNSALTEVGKYWRDEFGADGFRMDAARMAGTHPLLLASGLENDGAQAKILQEAFPETVGMSKLDRQLFVAGMTSNPPNTLRELFKDRQWENPFPTEEMVNEIHRRYPGTRSMSNEDMLMYVGTLDLPLRSAAQTGNLFAEGFREWLHPRDIAQDTGLEFWKQFTAEMKTGHPNFSILHEFGDDPRMAKIYKDAGAGDYFYLSSFDNTYGLGADGKPSMQMLRRDISNTLASMPDGSGVNWTPDNHDTTRFMTRMGFDPACNPSGRSEEECLAGQKLLMKFISHLPGNVTMYNGTELGLGSPFGREIIAQEGRDPLHYFSSATANNPHAQTHDYSRAAYPWSPEDYNSDNLHGGQGRFFRTPDSWRGRDYQTQNSDLNSVLHVFKKAMQERTGSPILNKTGSMTFLNYDFGNAELNNNVLIYARSNAEGQTQIFVDNFTNKSIDLDMDKLFGQHDGVDKLITARSRALLSTSMMADPYKITVDAYQEQDIGRPLIRESGRVESR